MNLEHTENEEQKSIAPEPEGGHFSLESMKENVNANIDSVIENSSSKIRTQVESIKNYAGAEVPDIEVAQTIGNNANSEIMKAGEEAKRLILSVNLNEKTEQEGLKTKELLASGKILDPELINKLAQIEAIDPNSPTFEFKQDRYDSFIRNDKRNPINSLTANQNEFKKLIDNNELLSESMIMRAHRKGGVIAGNGNYNRYGVDSKTGELTLISGTSKTNTSGSPEYFKFLKEKAKELGVNL